MSAHYRVVVTAALLACGCSTKILEAPAIRLEVWSFDRATGRESWTRLRRSGGAFIFEEYGYGLTVKGAPVGHARFVRDGKLLDCWNSDGRKSCESFPFDKEPRSSEFLLDRIFEESSWGASLKRHCAHATGTTVEEAVEPLRFGRSYGFHWLRVFNAPSCGVEVGAQSMRAPVVSIMREDVYLEPSTGDGDLRPAWERLREELSAVNRDVWLSFRMAWLNGA